MLWTNKVAAAMLKIENLSLSQKPYIFDVTFVVFANVTVKNLSYLCGKKGPLPNVIFNTLHFKQPL